MNIQLTSLITSEDNEIIDVFALIEAVNEFFEEYGGIVHVVTAANPVELRRIGQE